MTKPKRIVTSITLLKDYYHQFKVLIIGQTMTLQKLVNRSVYLYLTDEVFRETINKTNIKLKEEENTQ